MAEETKDESGSPETATETPEGTASEGTPVATTFERALDITIGLGALAFEAADRTARRVWEDAPSVVADLEEKGRPLREKMFETLRGAVPTVTETFSAARTDKPAPSDEEITALEDRVRELEKQVEAPAPPAEPSPFSMLEIDDVPQAVEETAGTAETTDGEAKPKKKRASSDEKTDAPDVSDEETPSA